MFNMVNKAYMAYTVNMVHMIDKSNIFNMVIIVNNVDLIIYMFNMSGCSDQRS